MTQDADHLIRKKLALLWTGPYQVVGKLSESLATIQPMTPGIVWAQQKLSLLTPLNILLLINGLLLSLGFNKFND